MNDSVYRQGYRLHKCLLLHELIICFAPKHSGRPEVNTYIYTYRYMCVYICLLQIYKFILVGSVSTNLYLLEMRSQYIYTPTRYTVFDD